MTSTVVPLSGEITLAEAEGLSRTLQDALAQGPVRIDATGLARADAAILQLLVAAQRMAIRSGHELQVGLDASGAPGALAQKLGLTFAPGGKEQTGEEGAPL